MTTREVHLVQGVAALIARFKASAHAAVERNPRRNALTRAAGESVAFGGVAIDALGRPENVASTEALRALASSLREEADREDERAKKNRTTAARWRGYARAYRSAADAIVALADEVDL